MTIIAISTRLYAKITAVVIAEPKNANDKKDNAKIRQSGYIEVRWEVWVPTVATAWTRLWRKWMQLNNKETNINNSALFIAPFKL